MLILREKLFKQIPRFLLTWLNIKYTIIYNSFIILFYYTNKIKVKSTYIRAKCKKIRLFNLILMFINKFIM